MNSGHLSLPTLTVNRSFMKAFFAADTPCLALGMIEVQNRQTGFLALRPNEPIPSEVTQGGFSFGHCLLGNATFEVVQFVFSFYNFQTYNTLINPNNPIVQVVLKTLIEQGDYFFFAFDSNRGSTTAFRAEVGQEPMMYLKDNLVRIQNSTTTQRQYQQALSSFAKNPYPEGILLNWVCRDNPEYLDPTQDSIELIPACL